MAQAVVHHPESTDAVRQLVTDARRRGVQVRVRGAAHSVAPAIAPDAGGVELRLNRLRDVVITPEEGGRALVEVGAGCNLGYDRYDPSGTSTWQNSLTQQLDQRGYALDCLGGISHQTVGGFLMTGSAGGSLVHDLGSNVVGLELVDGRGEVHRVSADDAQPEAKNLFEAAGVSLGLLGIVTRVWLRAGPAYDVVGSEVTSRLADANLDLFDASDRDGLVVFFGKHDYSRVLWWPHPGFDRVQVTLVAFPRRTHVVSPASPKRRSAGCFAAASSGPEGGFPLGNCRAGSDRSRRSSFRTERSRFGTVGTWRCPWTTSWTIASGRRRSRSCGCRSNARAT